MNTVDKEYLYGINPAFETVRAGRRRVYRAVLNTSARTNPRLVTLAGLLQKHAIPISWEEKGRLISLCGSREHQGVVLACSPYPYVTAEIVLEKQLVVLLDNIEDPHNVGAIVRSAEVFGYEGVMLPVRGVPEVYPSVVKASAGAVEFLDVSRDRTANAYIRLAREAGFTIAVLDARGTVDIHDEALATSKKLLLVIGGENIPVGRYILNNADYTVALKQKGSVTSLNASVAAGVAMFVLSAHRT